MASTRLLYYIVLYTAVMSSPSAAGESVPLCAFSNTGYLGWRGEEEILDTMYSGSLQIAASPEASGQAPTLHTPRTCSVLKIPESKTNLTAVYAVGRSLGSHTSRGSSEAAEMNTREASKDNHKVLSGASQGTRSQAQS